MEKRRDNRATSGNNDSSPNSFSELNEDELLQLEKAKDTLLNIGEKYNIPLNEIKSFLEKGLSFPLDILSKKLTVLESAVKYLKEEKVYSLRKIARFLGRDERNVWHIYHNSKEKNPKKFVIKKPKFLVPVSVFSNTKLSALESLVVCLKEKFSLNYHKIAVLLKRDDRTVWTAYQRARKKNAKSE